ncbi:hypothetical protein [Helicobacter cetorum]|uniref:hypothetical protein n=1 Tax=Helicobacter cetorum TaxID=138563 RepID=UPI000CF12936|nr:hypothetical protein [Helicobacter cetorum]
MFFSGPLNTQNYFLQDRQKPKFLGITPFSSGYSSYLDNLNSQPITNENPKSSNFSNFVNSVGGLGGMGMIGGAIGGIGSLITGAINSSEQNKNAKESMRMAREQFRLENERYNAREQERLANNKAVDNIAKNYDIKNPITRF